MDLVIYPNEILRKKTDNVPEINKEIKNLIKEMKKVMIKNSGVGLSANQVNKSLSIFIALANKKIYTFINPRIIRFIGKERIFEEGCLSLPKIWGQVKRYPSLIIEYQDIFGKRKRLRAKGLLSHIIQHEIDHLNGILFIDKALEIYKLEKINKTEI